MQKKKTILYLKKVTKLIVDYDITNRLKQLEQTSQTNEDKEYFYAKLDQVEMDLDKALLEAKNKLSSFPLAPQTIEM
eukprot:7466068-Ditylum_brightwellii.AAC.1